jgi:hypothetical protein
LFVVAESVEKIQNWKTPHLISVEAGRKKNTIGDAAVKRFAGQRIAFGARRSG